MVKTLFSLRKRGNYLNPYGSKIWNNCCDEFEKLLDQRITKYEDDNGGIKLRKEIRLEISKELRELKGSE